MSAITPKLAGAPSGAATQTPVVEFRDVVKRYAFRGSLVAHLKALAGRGDDDGPGFVALDHVDLRVHRGERVGICGRNGAGKTTLLKLVVGSSSPTAGDLRVNGSVQALMQLGVGFHPEFTGRVNVRSALTHLGLSGERLTLAAEEVGEFVELGEFLDQPLRTYSLGMKARLMFATATAVRPDILVIDEVLHSGDPYFTTKCADRVKSMVAAGSTLLLVSHSPQQMMQFCDRVVWLDHGKIVQDGDSVDVLNAYEAFIERTSERIFTQRDGALDATPSDTRAEDHADLTTTLSDGRVVHSWPGKEGVRIGRIDFVEAGLETPTLRMGDPTWFDLDLHTHREGEYALRYILTVWRSDGRRAARVENTVDRFRSAAGETRTVRADLGPMQLGPGDYTISVSVYDLLDEDSTEGGRTVRFDVLSRAIRFSVRAADGDAPAPSAALPGPWHMASSPGAR
jgi:lipopolysaccharide transport system ATP-binding protein